MFNDFSRDIDWFQDHYEDLVKDYDGLFVAVKDEKVLLSDEDCERLIKRLRQRHLDLSSMVIELVDSNPPHFILAAA